MTGCPVGGRLAQEPNLCPKWRKAESPIASGGPDRSYFGEVLPMGSGTKKGLLFVAICAVVAALIYAIGPTKTIRYLTTPLSTEKETARSEAPPQTTNVVRRKISDVPGRAGAPPGAAPIIVAKKIPPAAAAKSDSIGGSPAGGQFPVPAGSAGAVPAKTPGSRPAEISRLQGASDQAAAETKPAAAASQASQGAEQPAAASNRSGNDESPAAASTEAAASSETVRPASRKPGLREQPASHRIEGRIVPKPYSIMLASCRRLDSARAVVEQGRRKGLSPYIVRVDLGEKGVWWRIYEGKYSDLGEARAARSRQKLSEALVKKTPYAVMIGLYDDEKNAAAEVERLEKLDQTPYFVSAPRNKVRLLVGAFASEESARPLGDELSSRGIFNKIVKR